MSGVRNKRWSREHVTINQTWHARRYPDVFWRVYQCHHADEQIELVLIQGAGAWDTVSEKVQVVGVTELRKFWERVA
jgi:hypothetical protein